MTQETAPAIPAELADLAVPLDQLKPYGTNPRRGDVAAIADSLRANGQYRPIVVNRRTREVLAGNHTLAAARDLGWTHIAATWVDADPEQAARIVLIDNRANDLASYDDTVLAELLASLNGQLAGTGYDNADLDALLAGLEPARPVMLTDPDSAPPLPADEPITATGQIWTLGPHRLAVGDATDPLLVEALMAGEQADLVLTDPPYNVDYEGGTADRLTIANDDMAAPAFAHLLTGLFGVAHAAARPGAPIYVFHPDAGPSAIAFRQALLDTGWLHKQVLIWVKDQFVFGRQDWHWQHEPILYGWKPGGAHPWHGGRSLTTVIDDAPALDELKKPQLLELLRAVLAETTVLRVDRPRRNDLHPTMKPVALLTRLLDPSSARGDLVLDPCAGAGSTLIAAHLGGRRARLVELDPRYADVIARRWEQATGDIPLDPAGQPRSFL